MEREPDSAAHIVKVTLYKEYLEFKSPAPNRSQVFFNHSSPKGLAQPVSLLRSQIPPKEFFPGGWWDELTRKYEWLKEQPWPSKQVQALIATLKPEILDAMKRMVETGDFPNFFCMIGFSDIANLACVWDQGKDAFVAKLLNTAVSLEKKRMDYERECMELPARTAKVEQTFLKIWVLDHSHLQGQAAETPAVVCTIVGALALDDEEMEELNAAIAAVTATASCTPEKASSSQDRPGSQDRMGGNHPPEEQFGGRGLHNMAVEGQRARGRGSSRLLSSQTGSAISTAESTRNGGLRKNGSSSGEGGGSMIVLPLGRSAWRRREREQDQFVHIRYTSRLMEAVPLRSMVLQALRQVMGERSANWLEDVVIGWRYDEALGAKVCKPARVFRKFRMNEWEAGYVPEFCQCGTGRHAESLNTATIKMLPEEGTLHVITNDTGVTNNGQLQLMLNAGLNHIPLRALDEEFTLDEVEVALDKILTTQRCDEELSLKKTIVRENAKKCIRSFQTKHMHITGEPINSVAVRSKIEWLTSRYLVCPTDKAPHTPTFVCINFIRRLALQRLLGPDFTPLPDLSEQEAARLVREASAFTHIGHEALPLLHLMTVYKAHKQSFRWITNSAGSVLSPVADICERLLELLAEDVQALCISRSEEVHAEHGVKPNFWWPISSIGEFVANIPQRIYSIFTGDITRCFETIPTDRSEDGLLEAIRFFVRCAMEWRRARTTRDVIVIRVATNDTLHPCWVNGDQDRDRDRLYFDEQGIIDFRLVTDNNPLVFYKTQDTVNSTIARWMAFIDQFDFFPDHIPGKPNGFADALSRRPDHCTPVDSTFEIYDDLLDSFICGYQVNPEFCDKYANCSSPSPAPSHYRIQEGYLLVHSRGKDLLCVPRDLHLRTRLLGEFHDAPATGHFGVNHAIGRLRKRFWWLGLLDDVTRCCESCVVCRCCKSRNHRLYSELRPLPVPLCRREVIAMDITGSFPKHKAGVDGILTVVDRLTKFAMFLPCRYHAKAPELVEVLYAGWIRTKGYPKEIVCDRDTRFMSDFWLALIKRWGSSLKPSSAHHPQTDGQKERAHQTAQVLLRTLIRPDQKDWVERLPDVELTYNSSIQPTIGMSPFEFEHDSPVTSPLDTIIPRTAESDDHLFFLRRMQELLVKAHDQMAKTQERMSQQANRQRLPCPFCVGDLLWVSAAEFSLEQDLSRKLLPKWMGPWPIVAPAGDAPEGPSFTIQVPAHLPVYPVFHCSKLALYTPAEHDDFLDDDRKTHPLWTVFKRSTTSSPSDATATGQPGTWYTLRTAVTELTVG
ncbi:hypothetical protein CBR_g23250 [Chara braunii]|uniref:Integrase catalytic domain-containing protein n=1 Tax=Chara braunii TaxID=69332 RepID=A0A388JVC3_CHABU|nr:hypothetical protein CBR_g23250 [Chara braunii]|eukprot:GBG61735.1 hypothetical protein CBR_g23250 [Chara braunii]